MCVLNFNWASVVWDIAENGQCKDNGSGDKLFSETCKVKSDCSKESAFWQYGVNL